MGTGGAGILFLMLGQEGERLVVSPWYSAVLNDSSAEKRQVNSSLSLPFPGALREPALKFVLGARLASRDETHER